MLTDRQSELLTILCRLQDAGERISYNRLEAETGWWRQPINTRILALEKKGYIRRIPFARHGIEVIRRETDMTTIAGPGRKTDLNEAVKLLCEIHTRESDLCGFLVPLGERPSPERWKDYVNAWRMLRQLAGLPVTPIKIG